MSSSKGKHKGRRHAFIVLSPAAQAVALADTTVTTDPTTTETTSTTATDTRS